HHVVAGEELPFVEAVDLPQAAADAVAHHGAAKLTAHREPHAVFSGAVFPAVEPEIAVGSGATLAVETAEDVALFQGLGQLHPENPPINGRGEQKNLPSTP